MIFIENHKVRFVMKIYFTIAYRFSDYLKQLKSVKLTHLKLNSLFSVKYRHKEKFSKPYHPQFVCLQELEHLKFLIENFSDDKEYFVKNNSIMKTIEPFKRYKNDFPLGSPTKLKCSLSMTFNIWFI